MAIQCKNPRHSGHQHLYRHLTNVFVSQMRCLLLLVVGAAGVLAGNVPPLASHARASTHADDLPSVPQVNWGLSGVVTEELWEE